MPARSRSSRYQYTSLSSTKRTVPMSPQYLVRHKYGKDESSIAMWKTADGNRPDGTAFSVRIVQGYSVTYATDVITRSFTVSNGAREPVVRTRCVGHHDFAIKEASARREEGPLCFFNQAIRKWEHVAIGEVRNRSTGHVYTLGYTGDWPVSHVAVF
ncbi:hypothetical protein P43SY_006728 [Pythium insidiosum]|uniref:Uncharacterized protein n=1 Tax=Pythium insidiosum TaxID=114742 RepID=A0AAD5MIN1_PYTIN|nr:hypothetical protein P43SY_006728 [Pythium insidiosum]